MDYLNHTFNLPYLDGGSPTKTYQSDIWLRCILDRVLRVNVAELLTSSFQEAD